MSVQYLHMEKVGGVAASLQDHYDGATRAATAEARGGLAPVVDLLGVCAVEISAESMV